MSLMIREFKKNTYCVYPVKCSLAEMTDLLKLAIMHGGQIRKADWLPLTP